jgi:hypothetical protein
MELTIFIRPARIEIGNFARAGRAESREEIAENARICRVI